MIVTMLICSFQVCLAVCTTAALSLSVMLRSLTQGLDQGGRAHYDDDVHDAHGDDDDRGKGGH